jgi:hypothetical protein
LKGEGEERRSLKKIKNIFGESEKESYLCSPKQKGVQKSWRRKAESDKIRD